ncbi:MAG: nuclear transport factor 2 family protein [Planctomycetota bacterium]
MRTLSLALLFLVQACATTSSKEASPADAREVLETVQAFFDIFSTRDARAGAAITLSQGAFFNVREQEGQRVVNHWNTAAWLARLPENQVAMKETFDGEPTVLVAGDVAMVWAPYLFSMNGELSHSGVDLFNLLRTEDGWKIAGGAYSVVR